MTRTISSRLRNSKASIYILPLIFQTASNCLKKQNIEKAVIFFRDLVPQSICTIFMSIQSLCKTTSLNYRETDLKIAELIKPYQCDWEKELQEFLNATKDRKLEILSNEESKKRIIKLKSFLEKTHLQELRSRFPLVAQENLKMTLNQEANIKKCIKMIEDRENLKNKAISDVNIIKTEKDSEECQICCVEKILIVFPACGHKYYCKECASKLEKCPICRRPLNN